MKVLNEVMTVKQWHKVPENPRQRDTVGRAKRAKHLREYHPTHGIVYAARLKNGVMFKLDGHTRDFLWSAGEVKPPANINVTIFQVETIEDVKSLYEMFDSRKAVKTANDGVCGAFREVGLSPETPWISKGGVSAAIKMARNVTLGKTGSPNGIDIGEAVGVLREEIIQLDSILPKRNKFSTGVVLAALLTFRKDGLEAAMFWRAYNENGGVKDARGSDGVDALSRLHDSMRVAKRLGGGGNVLNIASKALSAYQAYKSVRRVSNLRSVNLVSFLGPQKKLPQ